MAEPKTEEFLDEIEKAEIEELGDELIDIDEEAAELDEIEALKVERDDSVIKSLEEEVRSFDISIEDLIIKIQNGGNKNG